MYYIEKIIDGVLKYKSHPKGEWKEVSQEAMSRRIVEMQNIINNLRNVSLNESM